MVRQEKSVGSAGKTATIRRVKCNDTLIFAEYASYAIPVKWETTNNDAALHHNTMESEAVNRRYWRLK